MSQYLAQTTFFVIKKVYCLCGITCSITTDTNLTFAGTVLGASLLSAYTCLYCLYLPCYLITPHNTKTNGGNPKKKRTGPNTLNPVFPRLLRPGDELPHTDGASLRGSWCSAAAPSGEMPGRPPAGRSAAPPAAAPGRPKRSKKNVQTTTEKRSRGEVGGVGEVGGKNG